jgi:monovalent cation:proton antiporter-2 (CPA2) family protein
MTGLLAQVAIFLAATVIAVPVFRRLRLSAVLGYLVSGIAIGPWGLGLIRDVESILHFAEFGVVLLLFVIGLELQPSRLLALRRTVFVLGPAQVIVTTLACAALAWLAGLPPVSAVVAGFGLSLSSTPMVLQILAERGALGSQHGRAAFGILLFQDLAVLPALAAIPLLGASATAAGAGQPLQRLLLGLAAVAVVVGTVRYALRPLLRFVAGTGIPDVFTATALLVVVATALLVDAAGLSMGLGAFIAGVLLADSEYRHELEADLEPFKGLLLGLLFIAVGMSVNLGLVVTEPLRIVATTAGLMLIKGTVAWGVARAAGPPLAAQARALALALLAGGEFGFVLFPLAASAGLMEPLASDGLVVAITLSMLCSPLILLAEAWWRQRRTTAAPEAWEDPGPRTHRVVIAGFGRFGQIVARVLRGRGIPFTALDVSQTQVDFVRRFGNQIFYGDAARPELLRAAQLAGADALVIAVDDQDAAVAIARFARQYHPGLPIFARARNRQHAFRLMEVGVTYLVRETLLSSLELTARLLEALGDPPADAARSVALFRAHDEATLAAQFGMRDDDSKFEASARAAAAQLEQLFEADGGSRPDGTAPADTAPKQDR